MRRDYDSEVCSSAKSREAIEREAARVSITSSRYDEPSKVALSNVLSTWRIVLGEIDRFEASDPLD